MLYPTINDLTKGEYNRYELALATAKCARLVTNEYVKQREEAEKTVLGNKESEKPLQAMIDKELKDEKAVKIAINRIHKGEYSIAEIEPVEEPTIEAPADEAEATEIAED